MVTPEIGSSTELAADREKWSGSKVRWSFRQHGGYFEKNDLAPAKSEMTLSGTREVRERILPGNGNRQTRRSAGLYRHAASGVAGAQGLHDL